MSTATQPPPAEASPTPRPTVGPERHGQAMDFDEFTRADFQEGWLYELARGIVIVSEVPGIHHGRIVFRFMELFVLYNVAHRGVINYLAGGAECRLQFEEVKSDRHPDWAIYLRPDPKGPRLWTRWRPEIVVEVVSASGVGRDYVEKRLDYLVEGIQEYWILDPMKRRMLVLLNRGESWEELLIAEDGVYQTELLPGLEVRVGELLGPPVPVDEE
jgi:Uma2 family endonuclease